MVEMELMERIGWERSRADEDALWATGEAWEEPLISKIIELERCWLIGSHRLGGKSVFPEN